MPWPPRLLRLVAPVAFATWSGVALLPYPEPVLAVLPLGFGVGGWLLGRSVAAGAVVVGATQAAGLLLGASPMNASGLLPAIWCLFLAGQRLSLPRGVGILGIYLTIVAATGLGVLRTLVGILLFTATWLAGQLLAESAAVVRARRDTARDLERRDHAVLAAQVVDRERGRILSGSLDIVEQAVSAMLADCNSAAEGLDADMLERVGRRGEAAIADLRRILGLLRSPPPAVDPTSDRAPLRLAATPALPAEAAGRGTWRADALLAVALGAVGLIEAASMTSDPATRATAAAVPLGLALWRTAPALSAVLCAAPLLYAFLAGLDLPHGVAEMLTVALIVWPPAQTLAEGRGRPVRIAPAVPALLVVALSALGVYEAPHLGIIPVAVAVVAAAAAASRTSTHRARTEAEDRIRLARRSLHSSVDEAVALERLRIARELHDITSHAVGAMVLQARAARALAGSDPSGARRAVENALLAGTQATGELAALAAMLREDAHRSEPETLEALVGRLRTTGLDIDLEGRLPADPALGFTVHRIVQEALANSARYAPGASVRVSVHEQDDQVRVVVRDGGARQGAAAPSGTGFGLAGLAERVRLQGGTLNVGPTGGGFQVGAFLPTSTRDPQPTTGGTAQMRTSEVTRG